ncbi:hypothetical protein CVT24_002207 [Panaeolus cyanescens]|uniref:Uncharacterized protein n=1 Tax=Panaeolus cyanescens TaxID=181874 RepID=A0A409X025_9AGAR|nr:hypothetical protein CVT24_002207 [Panaeolus cyanescens]
MEQYPYVTDTDNFYTRAQTTSHLNELDLSTHSFPDSFNTQKYNNEIQLTSLGDVFYAAQAPTTGIYPTPAQPPFPTINNVNTQQGADNSQASLTPAPNTRAQPSSLEVEAYENDNELPERVWPPSDVPKITLPPPTHPTQQTPPNPNPKRKRAPSQSAASDSQEAKVLRGNNKQPKRQRVKKNTQTGKENTGISIPVTPKKSVERQPLQTSKNIDQDIPKHDEAPKEPVVAKAEKTEAYTDPVVAGARWTDNELSMLFNFILGSDADKIFAALAKNPASVYKKACAHLGSGRTESAVSGTFARSKRIFSAIEAVEKFTGGGGDGDINDDSDTDTVISAKLQQAAKNGEDVSTLSVKLIAKWHDKGWYTLFRERYSANPAVSRSVERHSALEISDSEDDSPRPVKSDAGKVTEPKHTPARGFRVEAAQSLSNVSVYLESKSLIDQRRLEVYDQKMAMESRRLDMEIKREQRSAAEAQAQLEETKRKNKHDLAKGVLSLGSTATLQPEVIDAANKFLLAQFMD